MRSLLATAILIVTTASAFAGHPTILVLPAPGSMFLIGLGGAAVLFALRKKK
jgi:hypothetical protein